MVSRSSYRLTLTVDRPGDWAKMPTYGCGEWTLPAAPMVEAIHLRDMKG